MAQFYLVQGEHQTVPGMRTSLHTSAADADARAWELLKMQADYAEGFSLHTRGADGVSWPSELQRLRDWIDSDTLPDIWIIELEPEAPAGWTHAETSAPDDPTQQEPSLLDALRAVTANTRAETPEAIAAFDMAERAIARYERELAPFKEAMEARKNEPKLWAIRFESVDDEPETAGPFTMAEAESFAAKKAQELEASFANRDDWIVEIVTAEVMSS